MSTAVRKRYSMAEQLRDQYQTDAPNKLSTLFDEEPVDLDTFVKDKAYLNNPSGLFDFQWDLVRHMEQIFNVDTYIAMVEEFGEYWTPQRMVNYLIYEVGKGGGKDHGCRIGVSRTSYLLGCLKDPQGYYGLAPQDDIHTLNVAPTSNLARRAFFKPLGQLIQRSPWFTKRVLSEITPNSTSILLTKQLEMISGHSLLESFEGLNPIVAIADEIAGFRLEQERSGAARGDARSAQAVWAILRSSARSRFPHQFKCVAISYPRYRNDAIETLLATGKKDIEAKGDASRYYVFGPKGTVEVNPRHFGKTAEEAFPEDFAEDPDRANAMYKCMPQLSANRFFRNDAAITQAFPALEETAELPLEINYYWADDDPEAQVVTETVAAAYGMAKPPVPLAWQVQHVLNGVRPMAGCLYAIHADLALSGDRAGVAMSHVRAWVRAREDEHQDDRPIVKVDFVAAYEADLTAVTPDGTEAPREIQLRWVRKLIRDLSAQGFAIGLVTFDGWQSVDSTQIIESYGIPSKVQSIDRTPMPYQTLRDVMYDRRLEGYDDGVVVAELQGLTKLSNGKIDHPADGSKDEADALAGSVVGALSIGGDEGDSPEVVDQSQGMAVAIDGFGAAGVEVQDLSLANRWEDLQF